jgi:IS5 family transposase
MKPRPDKAKNKQNHLYRVELTQVIDMSHEIVKLAHSINWNDLEEYFGEFYSNKTGRPAISTRLMVAVNYLKYTFNLSDEAVLEGWRENPYWQYFSGMKYFEHKLPMNPSSMTRWRKKVGETGAEKMLLETISVGVKKNSSQNHN